MSGRAALCAVALAILSAGPAAAQVAPARPAFVFIDQERILTGSARGRALLQEEEAARDRLRAEARGIEQAFETEERQLTERRKELDAAAFRQLADDFDARVVDARRVQDEKAAALATEFDQRRRQFYADVAPALVRVMESRGAYAIFDESSVLLSDQSLNITEAVIAEIDRMEGEPSPARAAQQVPPQSAPQVAPPVPPAPAPAPRDVGVAAPQPEPRPAPPAAGSE